MSVKEKPKMKQVVAFVMAALAGLAVSARSDERHPDGYTNADIDGGYGCNVSGRLARADTVGIAQYHPEGFAQTIYSLQTGSAERCAAEFSSHIAFVSSGAVITADTCDIATLDPGVLLSGTCKKQDR
jgi:hypothetical protein